MLHLSLHLSLLRPHSVEREFHLHLAGRFEISARLAGVVRHDGLAACLSLRPYSANDSRIAYAPPVRSSFRCWERLREGQRRRGSPYRPPYVARLKCPRSFGKR